MSSSLAYILIIVAVIMFGIQFLFNDRFEKECGHTLPTVFQFLFMSSMAGFIVTLLIHRCTLDFTLFTFLMAAANAVNSILYSYCSLQALSCINLSLYSVFAMLGGMLLPFLLGLFIFSEAFTFGKALCLLLISAALAISIKKGPGSKKRIYYMGVFFLNGMSGVLSTIFEKSPFPKTEAISYTLWSTIITMVVSGIVLLFIRRKTSRLSAKAISYASLFGIINTIANYFLVLSLSKIHASLQYPFVTGGVMIVSTVISLFEGQHPGKREWLSVGLSFIGILFLVIF